MSKTEYNLKINNEELDVKIEQLKTLLKEIGDFKIIVEIDIPESSPPKQEKGQ